LPKLARNRESLLSFLSNLSFSFCTLFLFFFLNFLFSLHPLFFLLPIFFFLKFFSPTQIFAHPLSFLSLDFLSSHTSLFFFFLFSFLFFPSQIFIPCFACVYHTSIYTPHYSLTTQIPSSTFFLLLLNFLPYPLG